MPGHTTPERTAAERSSAPIADHSNPEAQGAIAERDVSDGDTRQASSEMRSTKSGVSH